MYDTVPICLVPGLLGFSRSNLRMEILGDVTLAVAKPNRTPQLTNRIAALFELAIHAAELQRLMRIAARNDRYADRFCQTVDFCFHTQSVMMQIPAVQIERIQAIQQLPLHRIERVCLAKRMCSDSNAEVLIAQIQ